MSNKSLFNKTLIKKDIKILAPILVINIILLIFALPFSYSQAVLLLQSNSTQDLSKGVASLYNQYNTTLINILVSTITAIMLFASEKSSKSLELLVSLPFSRKQIYFNKIAVGFIVNVLPNIVLHLISLFIVIAEPMSKPFFNIDFFNMYFLNSIALQIVVFTYFTVISMLFGNIFATAFCGYVFTLMPIGLVVMVQAFLDESISSASELQTAASTLLSNVDALFVANDNTVASAMPVLMQEVIKAKKPIYVGADSMVMDGGFATMGIDYEELTKKFSDYIIIRTEEISHPFIMDIKNYKPDEEKIELKNLNQIYQYFKNNPYRDIDYTSDKVDEYEKFIEKNININININEFENILQREIFELTKELNLE